MADAAGANASGVLGDHVSLVRGTTYKSVLLGQPGPMLLGLASIGRNGGFRSDSLRTYGGESAKKLLLRPGDLFVSLKDVTQEGDLLGSVARVPPEVELGRLTQDTVKLELRGGSAPSNYLYWLLRTPDHRETCRLHATGTTNLGLPREDFLALEVPPLTLERQALVEMLDAIETKVVLNRQTNHTLEEMASALFKSWFVDFDPIVAKADARRPFGMDAATAALFPPSFATDQSWGDIPRGWTTLPLDEVADFRNGLALQNFRPDIGADRLPVIKIAQLRTGRADGDEWAKANIDPSCILEDGDIVFSWSGSLAVVVWCGGRGALNQHLFKVTSARYPKWFFHQWTLFHLPEFQGIAADKATTMGHIRRFHLTDARCVVPPGPVLAAADRQMAPWLDLFIANELESRTLTDLRDTLLPKLLSGEVRLKQAERLVEAAP